MDERLKLYERAVFGGDTGALAAADRELDGVEADLAPGACVGGRLTRSYVLRHLGFVEQAEGRVPAARGWWELGWIVAGFP